MNKINIKLLSLFFLVGCADILQKMDGLQSPRRFQDNRTGLFKI